MRTHTVSIFDWPIAKGANNFFFEFHVAPKNARYFPGLFRNFLTCLFIKRPIIFSSATDMDAVVVFLNFCFHWLNYSLVGLGENALALEMKPSASLMIMLATLVETSRKF